MQQTTDKIALVKIQISLKKLHWREMKEQKSTYCSSQQISWSRSILREEKVLQQFNSLMTMLLENYLRKPRISKEPKSFFKVSEERNFPILKLN